MTITNETGGITSGQLRHPAVVVHVGELPGRGRQHDLCYPDYWTPPGATSPIEDWFNKYVVTAVHRVQHRGRQPPGYTTYSYSSLGLLRLAL